MSPAAQQCPGFCSCYDAYPELVKKHITQHRDFSRKVVAMRDKFCVGQVVSRMEVLKFLNDWLHNHLLNIDQQYGESIRK
jgi:hemerythrin